MNGWIHGRIDVFTVQYMHGLSIIIMQMAYTLRLICFTFGST